MKSCVIADLSTRNLPLQLILRPSRPRIHKGRKIVGKLIVGGEYREYPCVGSVQELNGMWKGAILAVFI